MMQRNQFGFTLFEITFVIVITLLLAALIAMGQHMTTDLKVNRLDHDLHYLQAAIYNSQDRLHSARGNLHQASSTGSADFGDDRNWNEIAGANWESASGKTFKLWEVRPAGVAGKAAYVSSKSSGGITGALRTSRAPIAGLKGDYIVCTDNVDGGLVKQLDLEMDDGDTASGAMMVSKIIGGTGIAADGIDKSSVYTVCLGV
jgi:type II secretory pathway pseudopilin PulG